MLRVEKKKQEMFIEKYLPLIFLFRCILPKIIFTKTNFQNEN
jgi:hypothetical protein